MGWRFLKARCERTKSDLQLAKDTHRSCCEELAQWIRDGNVVSFRLQEAYADAAEFTKPHWDEVINGIFDSKMGISTDEAIEHLMNADRYINIGEDNTGRDLYRRVTEVKWKE